MNKNYEVLNELVPKTQELHRAIFDKGYEQGQRDVLNEIRAEIAKEREKAYKMFEQELSFNKIVTYDKCLRIIDKYTSEKSTK